MEEKTKEHPEKKKTREELLEEWRERKAAEKKKKEDDEKEKEEAARKRLKKGMKKNVQSILSKTAPLSRMGPIRTPIRDRVTSTPKTAKKDGAIVKDNDAPKTQISAHERKSIEHSVDSLIRSLEKKSDKVPEKEADHSIEIEETAKSQEHAKTDEEAVLDLLPGIVRHGKEEDAETAHFRFDSLARDYPCAKKMPEYYLARVEVDEYCGDYSAVACHFEDASHQCDEPKELLRKSFSEFIVRLTERVEQKKRRKMEEEEDGEENPRSKFAESVKDLQSKLQEYRAPIVDPIPDPDDPEVDPEPVEMEIEESKESVDSIVQKPSFTPKKLFSPKSLLSMKSPPLRVPIGMEEKEEKEEESHLIGGASRVMSGKKRLRKNTPRKSIVNTDLIIDTPPVLTPIRAKKAVRDLLQADIVLTPVRKSRRHMDKKMDEHKDVKTLLQETKFAYMPNPTLFGSRKLETLADDDDDDDDGSVNDDVAKEEKGEVELDVKTDTIEVEKKPKSRKQQKEQLSTPLRRSRRLQEKEKKP